MPRGSSAKVTGVWEKEPDSGIWWIRYRENGVLHREKVGVNRTPWPSIRSARMKSAWAQSCPRICGGRRFGSGSEDIRRYTEKHHRDRGHIESRLKLILPDFENRLADQIKPGDIDGWIARNTKAAATANRSHGESQGPAERAPSPDPVGRGLGVLASSGDSRQGSEESHDNGADELKYSLPVNN